MKAIILENINHPLVYEDVEVTNLKVGQVLVRVLSSGLCGAQMMEIAGLKGNAKFVPHLMGHEGCGAIEKIGEGVTKVKVGQKVVMHWMKGSGIESPFPEYVFRGKKISSGKITTLSEFSIVSENRLTVVPEETPNDICSLLGCGMTTALGAINNNAQVKIGESVLVLGCGGLGLNLIQGLKLVGAGRIVGADIENKRSLSLTIGADCYFDLKYSSIMDCGEKFDVIFDTTGNAALCSSAVELLSEEGRMILVGQPKEFMSFNSLLLFRGKGQSISATQGGSINPDVDIPRYAKMSILGKLSAKNIITHRFNMSEINDAVSILKSGKCGRIILTP